MKAYRKIVYDKLGHMDSFGSIGTELAIFAAKNQYRIEEMDIKIAVREGEPRFSRSFTGEYKIIRAMFLSLWKIKKLVP